MTTRPRQSANAANDDSAAIGSPAGGPRAVDADAAAETDAAADTAVSPAKEPVPVVAIGASAGGLDPICEFLVSVAPGSGFAYVVVQEPLELREEIREIAGRMAVAYA